jgi:glycosyltransferase involved in cell wall biosynthesis
VAIVYDTIPASSGFSVPRLENHRFTTYLSMLKYFDEAIAISASAAEEFDGFRTALAAQGLDGPAVSSTLLPIEHIPAEAQPADATHDDLPMVLSVGSNEPRKNQIAVVYAAEMLWRQGKKFRLLIVGGRGDTGLTQIGDAATALLSAGRPIEVIRDISESRLADAYSRARFSVFVSFHEGYGLPVAESLAVGTPVIATDYGSTAEIAEGGGCILVDPRDDDALTAAMGKLLDDDKLLATLHEQIEDRDDTSWDDYARDIRNVVFVSKGALK